MVVDIFVTYSLPQISCCSFCIHRNSQPERAANFLTEEQLCVVVVVGGGGAVVV